MAGAHITFHYHKNTSKAVHPSPRALFKQFSVGFKCFRKILTAAERVICLGRGGYWSQSKEGLPESSCQESLSGISGSGR